MKKKAVFISDQENRLKDVFQSELVHEIQSWVELCPYTIHSQNLSDHQAQLADVEIAFSTWGMCKLSEDEIKTYFPNLKVLFYAAGTVKPFAEPFLKSGVTITSAQSANAIPVAEYTAAQIVLANKGYFQSLTYYKNEDFRKAKEYNRNFPGNYDTSVGIIGAGRIGRGVIERLAGCQLHIYVFDPYLSDAKARKLNVEKVSLEYLFANCQTISNHLANNEQTAGMLNGALFNLMKPYATFINTGRGAQVVEADLVQALKAYPGRTALLDVTFPEPVPPNHEFLQMPNVFLTPHISGSFNHELRRMAQFMLEELQRYMKNEPLLHEIKLEQLQTLG